MHIEIIFISIVILSLVGGYTKCLTLWDIRQPFSPVDRQDKGIGKNNAVDENDLRTKI